MKILLLIEIIGQVKRDSSDSRTLDARSTIYGESRDQSNTDVLLTTRDISAKFVNFSDSSFVRVGETTNEAHRFTSLAVVARSSVPINTERIYARV